MTYVTMVYSLKVLLSVKEPASFRRRMGITHRMKLLGEYGRATEAGIITTRRVRYRQAGRRRLGSQYSAVRIWMLARYALEHSVPLQKLTGSVSATTQHVLPQGHSHSVCQSGLVTVAR